MSVLVSIFFKYVLPVLAVVALFFGVFEYGKSQGYDAGHQAAWDQQQKTINGMVDAANALASENNRKISGLELDALSAQTQADALKAQVKTKRTQIVTVYKEANPQVAASCGWSGPTIAAINQILSAGQQASGAAAASAPGVSQ